ncbi:MAG TPA: GYD domain-containing protein [Terriglobia bacterium]|nr:GYD domain-containing protein [Terriglobia bacterium]
MATYLMLFSFTQQGIEKIKQLSVRGEAAKKMISQMGGEVQAYYMVMGGEFDTLFILKAPNEEKVAEMALAIAKLGNVRTRTHRLFNEEELGKITSALP